MAKAKVASLNATIKTIATGATIWLNGAVSRNEGGDFVLVYRPYRAQKDATQIIPAAKVLAAEVGADGFVLFSAPSVVADTNEVTGITTDGEFLTGTMTDKDGNTSTLFARASASEVWPDADEDDAPTPKKAKAEPVVEAAPAPKAKKAKAEPVAEEAPAAPAPKAKKAKAEAAPAPAPVAEAAPAKKEKKAKTEAAAEPVAEVKKAKKSKKDEFDNF